MGFIEASKLIRTMVLVLPALVAPLNELGGQADVIGGVRLRPGQKVRVHLADGRRFEARLAKVDSIPRALHFLAPQQVVPVIEIDSLWLQGRATGRAALVGGIVVGGASFAFLVVVCRALGEGECKAWGTVVGLTVVGAGGGALVGAAVGTLIPTWRPIDPKRITVSLHVGTGLTAALQIRF